MPLSRPTLTQLKQQAAQDLAVGLPGADALLRFSNLNVLSVILANFANLHYGYLDYIAQQAVPFTATDEALEGWAALKDVFRLSETEASGVVTFPATTGVVVPTGTLLSRGDGVQFASTADATAVSGAVAVPAVATSPAPTGSALAQTGPGASGNTPVGSIITLGVAITGVQSSGTVTTAFTGGADVEGNDSLRSRMLAAYQTVPGTGTPAEYVKWARAVNGVTRAWCAANGAGTGTVVVYTMWDVVESANNGFPVGTNGVATGEARDTAATGDQLAVANAIFPLQGATPLVYSVAPVPLVINHGISGLSSAPVAVKNAIIAALADVYIRTASPISGFIYISDLEAAIASVAGSTGFVLTFPAANITVPRGNLPIPGTTTFS